MPPSWKLRELGVPSGLEVIEEEVALDKRRHGMLGRSAPPAAQDRMRKRKGHRFWSRGLLRYIGTLVFPLGFRRRIGKEPRDRLFRLLRLSDHARQVVGQLVQIRLLLGSVAGKAWRVLAASCLCL